MNPEGRENALTANCDPSCSHCQLPRKPARSNPLNPIVGKWVSTTNPARTIEFYDDGTFHFNHGDGNYQFPDAAPIILVPEAGDLFSSLKTIRVDDSTLVFTDAACQAKPAAEKLRRLPD